MSTSTRANFFSSLLAVAKIALIAFAVTSSPESDVTGQVPRYFTWYGTVNFWLHESWQIIWLICWQIIWKTLNCTPSTIGSTSPGPEESSSSSEEEETVFYLTPTSFLLTTLTFMSGRRWGKGSRKRRLSDSLQDWDHPSFCLWLQLRREKGEEQLVAEKNLCSGQSWSVLLVGLWIIGSAA